MTYDELTRQVAAFARGTINLGLGRQDRVGIYLEKRFETVVSCFGTSAAGMAFVPINPLLKPDQVGHILRDCAVRMLITSPERQILLSHVLSACPDLRHVVIVGETAPSCSIQLSWASLLEQTLPTELNLLDEPFLSHRVIDTDMAAIFLYIGKHGETERSGAFSQEYGGRRQKCRRVFGQPCRGHAIGGASPIVRRGV